MSHCLFPLNLLASAKDNFIGFLTSRWLYFIIVYYILQ